MSRLAYVPTFADAQRLEANDYNVGLPECICASCKCEYWKHRPVRGYPKLVRLCDGTFVQIE
jgi:hypothetical protein